MRCGKSCRVWMSLIGMSLVVAVTVVVLRSGLAEAEQFNPRVVLRESLPSIKNAPFVNAGEAGLHESELILGVSIGRQARAYPVNMLTGPSREIINGAIAGQAIAATW